MSTETNGERFTLQYGLGTAPVPIHVNTSEEYFEREREKVFKRVWLNVGRVEEIPKAGQYIVQDLPILHTSIIVVRGPDGQVRGFHNMCKHRGMKIATGEGGATKLFACRFHGWTYDLEGKLVYVPDEEQFFHLPKCDLGLTPVATAVWEGFIFIHIDPHPTESLEEFLGELGKHLSGYPFGDMPLAARYTATIRANWKVCIDAFVEGYHVAGVHRRSVLDQFTSKENPFCRLLPNSVRLYQRHRVGSIYANPQHKLLPVEEIAFRHSPTIWPTMRPPETMPDGINPGKSSDWIFDVDLLFPNFEVFPANGWYLTYNFWPLTVDQTYWDARLYISPPQNAGERISQEFTRTFFHDTFREDLSTLELTQSMLRSGAATHLQLSDQEVLVRHGYQVVADYVEAP
jgi:phenylpropionate dioxygenase-like ring-hydroxylating dioxygenase large terminal subunit